MVHVGASDSSWQRDRKEERQSKRVTMKDHAGLYLSKFFSCGLVILQKKRGQESFGKPEGWCFLQNFSEGPHGFPADPEVQETEFILYRFEFLIQSKLLPNHL